MPAKLVEQIGADDLFLFSTDIRIGASMASTPTQGLPPALLGKALRETPLATYPRLKETA